MDRLRSAGLLEALLALDTGEAGQDGAAEDADVDSMDVDDLVRMAYGRD